MVVIVFGYLIWGIENNLVKYGLGDLGGWFFDLLQIWGVYCCDGKYVDLVVWFYKYFGKDEGFGYDDVFVDVDVWLIVFSMRK